MNVAIIQTPGSNCDQDALFAIRECSGLRAKYVWHKETSLAGFDAAVIPGGFTYGDYLRGGAIAALSPIIAEVRRFADEGKPVAGICNGFQILTEAGILPGALVRNSERRFLCRNVFLKRVNETSIWTRNAAGVLSIPIAHNEGRYVADEETLRMLQEDGRIAFVYTQEDGTVTPEASANGASLNIAGILNAAGNVIGLMPHPERAADERLASCDGRQILSALQLAAK